MNFLLVSCLLNILLLFLGFTKNCIQLYLTYKLTFSYHLPTPAIDQTQRDERYEATRLQMLEDELRLPKNAANADELDDYCDAICKLHDCPFGQQDVQQHEACLCFDYSQEICEFTTIT